MVDDRPPVPAAMKRRVLIEAGHRCAIPTCRHIEVDIHHITPWATVRAHTEDNLIALCPNCHRRADREEIDKKSLRIYKFNLQSAHDKYSAFEIDFLFELQKNLGVPIGWPSFNMLLLNRLAEANLIERKGPEERIMLVGSFPIFIVPVGLTMAGRTFLDSLSEKSV